jgi:large subunit ribosomal protein L22
MSTRYSTTSDPATTARAYGRDLDCSPKSGRNVARFIKGMPVERAFELFDDVEAQRRPIPFKVRMRKIHHRRGTGFGPGKYPVGVIRAFRKILDSAVANAEYKGLEKDRLVISHATAYQGTVNKGMTPRAQGRSTAHYNRLCNLELILAQSGEDEEGATPTPAEARVGKGKKAKAEAAKAKAAAKPKAEAERKHEAGETHAHEHKEPAKPAAPKAEKPAAKPEAKKGGA